MNRRIFLFSALAGASALAARSASAHVQLPPEIDTYQLHYLTADAGPGATPLWMILDSTCDICGGAYADLRSRAAVHDRALVPYQLRFAPVGSSPETMRAAVRAFSAHSIEGFFQPDWEAQTTEAAIQAVNGNNKAAWALPGYPAFIVRGKPIKMGYAGWSDFLDWLSA